MPRKPKDCGCGGGKQCVSKGRRRGGQAVAEDPQVVVDNTPAAEQQKEVLDDLNQKALSMGPAEGKKLLEEAKKAWLSGKSGGAALAMRDAAYMLDLYMKKHKGKPKKTGGALKKDMMKFAKEQLEKMDCGCGCAGTNNLRKLSGGRLKDCPAGYSKFGELLCKKDCPAGMRNDGIACRGCPPGYTDTGLTCLENCKPGERDDGLFCARPCPGGWRDDGTACRKCPGGYTDMGAHCQKWSWKPGTSGQDVIGKSYGKKTVGQDVIWRDTFERIDWAATAEDLKKGFEEAFSSDGPLARAFDPEKNGVAESFRKFGENTEAAFKDLGEKMEKAFDPEQNGVGAAFRKFGEDMANTLGNDQWWRDTMSNPDTYIFLIGTIASVAAIVLSGGTAGPGVIAALSALGPSLNMISAAAQGKPIDPMDIAGLALAVIPVVGQAAGGFDDAIKGAMQAGQAAGKANQTTQLGKVLATATNAANKIGSTAIRTGLLSKLDKVVNLLDDVVKVAGKTKGVMKNPKSLLSLLKSPAAEKAMKVPWAQLSKAEKVKKVTEMGMKVVKAGKYAIKAAKYGESQGLYTIPQVQTGSGEPTDPLDAELAGDIIPNDQIDWDNPPEGYDYIIDIADEEPSGSGRTYSCGDVNMMGTGSPEDLAYMGIDMSPLEGSGNIPNKSYESWYDRTMYDNVQKKMDLVRRRAAQRTVKILPYTERPALLSDTFKVDAGRDIHGQVQGGSAFRGAFTRGSEQAGETEEKFYYPAFSGREARGEVAAGGEFAGQLPMGSSLGASIPSRAVF